ncbi:MAG: Gfo/Idh/MocA family oxidoreductase [Chloroflexi bacterium]|nr:Gfo/Idh/MocA family oxidoreductase [Chloroflexota bacterium]
MNKNHRTITVGVIGVGSMGQHHARILASLPGVKLVGVADANAQVAGSIAALYGAEPYTDYRQLLGKVEAVTIAAPTAMHHAIGLECISRGLHGMMEKPVASTAAQARELDQAAQRHGVVLQAGHVERFNPTFGEMANVLAKERLLALEARRLSPYVPRAAETSAVLDLMVHDLDLCLTLADSPVVDLQALGIQAKVPNLDHASAHLLFASGVMASLTASKISQQKVRELTAICEGGVVQADLLARTVVVHREAISDYRAEQEKVMYRQQGVVEQVYVPMVEPLYAELKHFVDCVREGRTPLVTARDGIRVLELAEAIERSATASLAKAGEPLVEKQD